jgi:hypothetical protein
MESFQAIRAYLAGVRRRLRRLEAVRALLYLIAALVALAVLGPLLATSATPRALATLRLALLVLAGMSLVVFAALGLVVPRLRLRRDPDVARHVGAAAPPLASDLLSAVELEPEVGRSPRFSRDLALALAADIAVRLDLVDPRQVVPSGTLRRPGFWLGAATLASVLTWALAADVARTGWLRLVAPPPLDALEGSAAPVSEPLVGDLKLVLTYPAYTGRAPLFVPASTGDIVAPRGTRIALETTALRVAAAAKLVFDPLPGEPPSEQRLVVDGRALRTLLAIDKPRQFRFLLQPPEGRPLLETVAHRIEIEPDRPPRVELIAPAAELDVSSRRRVELAYNVDDDYGIGEIALVWRSAAGKEERKLLPTPRAGARTAQAKFYWDLADVALPPGARVTYHLEAKDNDDVGGPNVGVSKSYVLRVFSPRERHEEVVEREQQVFEAAVQTLSGRLTPTDGDAMARAAYEELERLVVDLAALLTAIDADTLAPKGLKAEIEGMHGRLEKLLREEQPLVADPDPKKRLSGEHDKKVVPELERDVLALDDWLARQRMEELLAISDELKQHRARLHDLLSEYARTHSEKVREEIEREIKAIEQRMAELEAKAQKLGGEVADRFMNADAVTQQAAEDCFAKVRELVAKGDIAGADKQLERCARQADAQAEALENGLRGLRNDRFNEEEKAYGELLGEVMDLERDQRKLAGDADELEERYKKRAAEAARDRKNPQADKAKKTLERLRREVAEIPRDGLTPFSQEEYDALKQRIDDTGRMLEDGDVAEALSLARHIEDEVKIIDADLQDNLAGGHPQSARTEDAAERLERARPTVQELLDELQQATPSPAEIMSGAERARAQELKRRQKQLRERADRIAQKAQKKSKELPGQSGEATQKGLGEAGEQMGRAEERFGAPDPMSAHDEAEGAADKLSDLQKQMNRSARPSTIGQNGKNPDEEPVKIPGSDEYKPPEAFREDILDAMKKEKPPDAYKDQVKRYYEELVK